MSLYYRRGGVDAEGKKKTPFVLTVDGQKTRFVAFCRECHIGLCRDVEVGLTENGHNVIFVYPHVCGKPKRLDERYAGVLEEGPQ